MSSFSYTDTEAFTIAHARRIASKVATDLLRFQSLYNGVPSDATIDSYEKEIVEYLRHDVVESVTYGFKRDGKWTESAVRYRALSGGTLVTDDDPGKIRPRLDVAGATFTSFLVHNNNWSNKTVAARQAIENACPFQRTSGTEPPLETGSWTGDLNYFAGGRGLGRSTVRK
jgi:Bacterial HORMA domain family 1